MHCQDLAPPCSYFNAQCAVRPAAGRELVDALASEPLLSGYHLLPSVRGDLLAKLGRLDEARAAARAQASARPPGG
jgi:predicted RNA polymerase sigma factor